MYQQIYDPIARASLITLAAALVIAVVV